MGDSSGVSIFIQVLAGDRGASPGFIHEQWHDITKKLHDPKSLAEFGVLQAAGAFLGPAGFTIGIMEEVTKDRSSAARAISAQALAESREPASREALEQALADKSWIVRATAAQAIGVRGSPHAVALLTELLDDSRREVRYNAAASIVRLVPASPKGPAPAAKSPTRPSAAAHPAAAKP